MSAIMCRITVSISIHPPLAGRDADIRAAGSNIEISIHPPLAGRDRHTRRIVVVFHISIHPPLAGRDFGGTDNAVDDSDFNPPAPCGAGRIPDNNTGPSRDFNPPAPCGAGRLAAAMLPSGLAISIHPPLAGRDRDALTRQATTSNFNPPAPCGAGPSSHANADDPETISIHPPLAGRDAIAAMLGNGAGISIHPPLAGRDSDLAQKTVQNIAYCTKSAFTLAVLSGFLALMRSFFLPNVHKFRCEPSEESLLTPRSHAYTIRTPSG